MQYVCFIHEFQNFNFIFERRELKIRFVFVLCEPGAGNIARLTVLWIEFPSIPSAATSSYIHTFILSLV